MTPRRLWEGSGWQHIYPPITADWNHNCKMQQVIKGFRYGINNQQRFLSKSTFPTLLRLFKQRKAHGIVAKGLPDCEAGCSPWFPSKQGFRRTPSRYPIRLAQDWKLGRKDNIKQWTHDWGKHSSNVFQFIRATLPNSLFDSLFCPMIVYNGPGPCPLSRLSTKGGRRCHTIHTKTIKNSHICQPDLFGVHPNAKSKYICRTICSNIVGVGRGAVGSTKRLTGTNTGKDGE